ncbi:thymine dioxygenase [Mycena vulgaris]|nr:thymine dioxygenase [Mycena vulgaris]
MTLVPGDAGIPIVDFAPFLDGSNKQVVADEILSSFKHVGFVYLLNHGMSREQVAKIFQKSKEFFVQPVEVKKLAPHPPPGAINKGYYSSLGREKVIGSPITPTAREQFQCGREDDAEQPNIWLPDGMVPGFRGSCMEFFWLCYEVELNILRALALGLGLTEDYFVNYHRAADNGLRLLRYPSVPVDALRNGTVGRISAHSDYASIITLLLQDEAGGLEIEDPDVPGLFRPAPPIADALIVNSGDFLMRWSNNTIRSTVHRVRAPLGRTSDHSDGMAPERYSIAYFCTADMDTVVDCIPGTWNAERPRIYEPIMAREYVMKSLSPKHKMTQ